MRILIVGNGGREHALAWKIYQSAQVQKIFIAPGNAGTSLVGENVNLITVEQIIGWLEKNSVDLVIIGPDNYLAEGLADEIQKLNIPVFGPTKNAAEIEWSKSFAKKLMQEEDIPTARFQTFTDLDQARKYVRKQKFPLVIKANGLALGKGVIIAQTSEEAKSALTQLMQGDMFGDAGKEVIIEEYLKGKEISIHAFCDGDRVSLFPSSQDHKRIFDGDKGLNTGGMGTIAPLPWVTGDLMKEIEEKIVLPCIKGLKKRGRPFVGVLYPGIIVTVDGPKVIEFNARFGDPETQSYMRILKTDLIDILFACVKHNLADIKIEWDNKSACCIALASGGYPGVYKKGKIIAGLEKIKNVDVEIFHAGTRRDNNGEVVTSGGRVLGVTAVGETAQIALSKAYEAVKSISFDGMQFRRDIGQKSI
ncbi:MAG: phosphoribosylamine--glycine ligase [bacterium]|nr:phosphoribosylamine--glycine ligase [bacterium]